MQKILFIGASGMLGKPVAIELISAGHDVTLLSRDVSKMNKLFPDAKICAGDIFDIESLKRTFTEQDIIYLN